MNIAKAVRSRTKKVGAPWLSRSLLSGSARQARRTRDSAAARSATLLSGGALMEAEGDALVVAAGVGPTFPRAILAGVVDLTAELLHTPRGRVEVVHEIEDLNPGPPGRAVQAARDPA